jgi:deazaflavin-dependent oxidoreductase (nitroreductase family)
MSAAHASLPRWLPIAARINAQLLRAGVPIGSQVVLTVVGRRSGRPRSLPVSIVEVDGARYVVSGEGTAWVANARAAGQGTIERGRRRDRVRLTEIAAAERPAVLRAFWHQVPHGRPFIARLFGLAPDATADDFASAGPRCPVFRLEPV